MACDIKETLDKEIDNLVEFSKLLMNRGRALEILLASEKTPLNKLRCEQNCSISLNKINSFYKATYIHMAGVMDLLHQIKEGIVVDDGEGEGEQKENDSATH